MNSTLTKSQKKSVNSSVIPFNNFTLDEQEIKNRIENDRLKKEKEKRIKLIKNLRGNNNSKPSIYFQDSHSIQLLNCLLVPENTLLILVGESGIESRFGHDKPLMYKSVIELLKRAIKNKDEMDTRLKELRKIFPMLTFHYSNYFGIKPTGDKKREMCDYNTTESYYDIQYSKTIKEGLNTINQNYKTGKPWISIDICPYHTKQILKRLSYITNENLKFIKEEIPYFDIRNPETYEEFKNGQELYDYYFKDEGKTNIFKIMDYEYSKTELKKIDWDNLKLSELMRINGSGIYIHSACRPFKDNEYEMTLTTKRNSINTLIAAQCPIETKIIDEGYEGDTIIIGKYYGCLTLEEITIGKSITELKNFAFGYCNNLEEVIFEKGSELKIITQGIFFKCEKLKEIKIPESVEKLGIEENKINNMELKSGYGVFQYCYNLKNIELPKNLKTIHSNTFFECLDLENIVLPQNLVRIEKKAFYKCRKLRKIEFPETLEYIGDRAFSDCTCLKEITIPDSVNEISSEAFDFCNLEKVILSNNIEIIEPYTFRGSLFKNIKIPKKIKQIKRYSFSSNSLELVEFQSGNQNIEIEENAFNCESLKKVIIYSNTNINSIAPDHQDNKKIFGENCVFEIKEQSATTPKPVLGKKYNSKKKKIKTNKNKKIKKKKSKKKLK